MGERVGSREWWGVWSNGREDGEWQVIYLTSVLGKAIMNTCLSL